MNIVRSSSTIEGATPTQSISSFFKNILKNLDNFLGLNDDQDAEIGEEKPFKDSKGMGRSFDVKITTRNEDDEIVSEIDFVVKVYETTTEGKVNILVEYDNDTVLTKQGVTETTYKQTISSMIKQAYEKVAGTVKEGQTMEVTNGSVHLNAKFKKVQSSSKYDEIQLVSIKCSDDPGTALMVVDSVLQNDDFVNSIGAENSYSIDYANDEIAYQECQECECCELQQCYITILRAALQLYSTKKAVSWNAKGEQFNDTKRLGEELWDITYQIDSVAEWCVRDTGSCPSICELLSCQSCPPIDTADGFDYIDAVKLIQEAERCYLETLKLFICNVPESCKSLVNEWIRNLDTNVNYSHERPLII